MFFFVGAVAVSPWSFTRFRGLSVRQLSSDRRDLGIWSERTWTLSCSRFQASPRRTGPGRPGEFQTSPVPSSSINRFDSLYRNVNALSWATSCLCCRSFSVCLHALLLPPYPVSFLGSTNQLSCNVVNNILYWEFSSLPGFISLNIYVPLNLSRARELWANSSALSCYRKYLPQPCSHPQIHWLVIARHIFTFKSFLLVTKQFHLFFSWNNCQYVYAIWHLWGNSKILHSVSLSVTFLVQWCWRSRTSWHWCYLYYTLGSIRSNLFLLIKVQKSAPALFCTIIILVHLVQKPICSFLFEISVYAVAVVQRKLNSHSLNYENI